jgi:hypothetical protein
MPYGLSNQIIKERNEFNLKNKFEYGFDQNGGIIAGKEEEAMSDIKPLPTKPCPEMTDEELAEVISLGAWRENSYAKDDTAYAEAARRGWTTLSHD